MTTITSRMIASPRMIASSRAIPSSLIWSRALTTTAPPPDMRRRSRVEKGSNQLPTRSRSHVENLLSQFPTSLHNCVVNSSTLEVGA